MRKKKIIILNLFIITILVVNTACHGTITEQDPSKIAKITPMPCNVTCTIIHNPDGSVDMFVPAKH
ncbi:MAG: hypothetical protein Q8942_10885 [Bacillota bacterium]|nr:hypothetical protein [Bacillota bacterium]